MDVSRREAIHRLSRLVGGVISAPAMNAILSGCRAEPPTLTQTTRALGVEQSDLLGFVVDQIIPTTETPGAKEVGVVGFIDTLLDRWVDPEDKRRFLDGLAGLDEAANAEHGSTFVNAPAEYQAATLDRLDREAVQARRTWVNPLPFFATLKEWTLVGYYTSEIGATQELQWLASPGRYDGDVPLTEAGPTWA